MTTECQRTAPERIYLNIFSETDEPFPNDHECITWCVSAVGDTDVVYLRGDIADAEIARLQAQLAASQALVAELADALRELVSTVRGECPSLLNEDSGGSPELSFRVDDALAKAGRPTAPAKADASAAVRESHDAALASASSVIYPKD